MMHMYGVHTGVCLWVCTKVHVRVCPGAFKVPKGVSMCKKVKGIQGSFGRCIIGYSLLPLNTHNHHPLVDIIGYFKFERNKDHFTAPTHTSQQVEFFHSLILNIFHFICSFRNLMRYTADTTLFTVKTGSSPQ